MPTNMNDPMSLIEQMRKASKLGTGLNLTDPNLLNPNAMKLDMPQMPSGNPFGGTSQPFDVSTGQGNPFTPTGDSSPFVQASEMGSQAGAQAAGVGKRMMDQFKSPMGIAGTIAALATTDWSDPKSVGSSLGGLAGGAAGGALAGAKAGAAAGSVVPVIGNVVGGIAGALGGGALGGLFGGDEEEEAKKKAKRDASMQELTHNMKTAADYLQQSNMARFRGL